MPETGRRWGGRFACPLLAAVLLLQAGCLVLATGAAVGGAAAVGYAYWQGRLYRDYPANLGDTLAAVHTSRLELQFPIYTEESESSGAFVTTKTSTRKKVKIYLDRVPSPIPAEGSATRVSIRVGTFGDDLVSARILDQIALHLAPPAALTPTPQPAPGVIQPTSASAPGALRPMQTTAEPPLATPASQPARPK